MIGVAIALYDNIAEWSNELDFKRNELLRVIDERPCFNSNKTDTGWWYCVNAKGKSGFAPANRLYLFHRFKKHNIEKLNTIRTNHSNNLSSMYFGDGKLPTWNFNESLSSSFPRDSFETFSFDSGSIGRLFPTSALDRFKHTPLRRLSSGDIYNSTGSVVRNIPIKIERAKNGYDISRDDGSSERFSSANHPNRRESSAPPESFVTLRVPISNGRSMGSSPTISTTLLSERFLKGTNSSASTGTADRSTPTINDDQSKPRAHTPIPITISKSASCLRPEIATKPKLITIFQNLRDKNKNLKANNTAISANSDMNFVNKPKNGPDEIAEIAWRLKNLAKSRIDNTSAKSENRIQVQHSSPLNTAICDQNIARISNSSNDSDSDSIVLHAAPVSDSSNLLLNTTLLEDGNTSSPSSSGIVADLNDSNTDSNQRASATSSISASSSYEQSSDLNEPGYDTPRAPSETNNDHQPHFHDSVTTSRNPRLQQKSSSALHNLFTELSLNNRWRKNPETAFNYSLNLDNRPSWGKRFERSPSTAPEGFYGTLRFDVDENRGKREISVAPELLSMSKYKDCNNCDDEALSRKRIVCAKLSENFRLIDIAVKKMNECTAPRAWRQPHILQRHLPDIKDIVHNISFATNSFMDAIYLIAIDTSNSKSDDLRQLSAPLRNSQMLINQLKQNLDNTGWTLATLSRPRMLHGPAPGNDALDQFIAVVKQLPNDCYKILQWTLSLSPSATVLFLSSKPFERNDQLSHFHRNGLPSIPVDDPKRYSSLSSTSTSTNMTVSSDDILPSASAANKLLHNQMGSANLYSLRVGENRPINTETVYSRNSSNGTRVNSSVSEGRVMEEDDLESILSDRESISQDYAIVGEDTQLKQRRRPTTNVPPTQQIDTKIIASLSDDDRQLLRFYSPQMDGHTDFLSKAIEEFLNVVEEQQPPREFVQKGKLVILAAHKLIYIGDSISQCIGSVPLSSEIRRAADRLCCILKNCVQTTKQAADEYPSVSAIQSMVDCIVTVSHAAHDLKLLVKQCCC